MKKVEMFFHSPAKNCGWTLKLTAHSNNRLLNLTAPYLLRYRLSDMKITDQLCGYFSYSGLYLTILSFFPLSFHEKTRRELHLLRFISDNFFNFCPESLCSKSSKTYPISQQNFVIDRPLIYSCFPMFSWHQQPASFI